MPDMCLLGPPRARRLPFIRSPGHLGTSPKPSGARCRLQPASASGIHGKALSVRCMKRRNRSCMLFRDVLRTAHLVASGVLTCTVHSVCVDGERTRIRLILYRWGRNERGGRGEGRAEPVRGRGLASSCPDCGGGSKRGPNCRLLQSGPGVARQCMARRRTEATVHCGCLRACTIPPWENMDLTRTVSDDDSNAATILPWESSSYDLLTVGNHGSSEHELRPRVCFHGFFTVGKLAFTVGN